MKMSREKLQQADARAKRDKARKQIEADKIDPGVLKNSIKRSKKFASD